MLYRGFLIPCLALACVASAPAQTSGSVKGHLTIVSMATVQPADGNLATVTVETYREYPLVVLSEDGKQTVAVVTADAHGNFQAALPAGSYVLDVQSRKQKHVRAIPVPFKVVAGQTATVNLEMDTGVR